MVVRQVYETCPQLFAIIQLTDRKSRSNDANGTTHVRLDFNQSHLLWRLITTALYDVDTG